MDDRYLVYKLLHKAVSVDNKGKKFHGVVRRVFRNILDGVVEITVEGKSISFDEPSSIQLDGDDVVFCYGRRGLAEESDEMLWDEVTLGANTGESLDDVLKRTAPAYNREIRFRSEPV